MKLNLSDVEVRVLGSLLEKEMTTPDGYPLTLNALESACNQKSNRSPLMNLVPGEITDGLDRLAYRGLARQTMTGGRVARYRHSLADKELTPAALAVLAELLLRGPQTAGELRTRGERMTPLTSLAQVEEILHSLMNFGPPLVTRLPRRQGQKDVRYAHLMSGEPQVSADDEPAHMDEPVRSGVKVEDERVGKLRGEVALLREEITALREAMAHVKAQFE